MSERNVILEVKHVSISFSQYEKGYDKIDLPVIEDLSVVVHEREMVAVVGSSGSGKSLLAHGILGILPYNAALGGEMRYCGNLLESEQKEKLRGSEIVLIPQSVSYLDPLMKIGDQIRKGKKDKKSRARSEGILKRYGLEKETQERYPFELSGGMTRRILISTAVMEEPKLVIADEPTPGLSMDAARRVLGHLREIADEGAGILLITHDLELALQVADRIAIFYAGTVVEDADVRDFDSEESLRHPYTKALYRAMPQHGFQAEAGSQPYVKNQPKGCRYQPRCKWATKACEGKIPYQAVKGGMVRCIHSDKGENT